MLYVSKTLLRPIRFLSVELDSSSASDSHSLKIDVWYLFPLLSCYADRAGYNSVCFFL